jgi:hypothetical protein
MWREAGGPEPEFWGDKMLREMRAKRHFYEAPSVLTAFGGDHG